MMLHERLKDYAGSHQEWPVSFVVGGVRIELTTEQAAALAEEIERCYIPKREEG